MSETVFNQDFTYQDFEKGRVERLVRAQNYPKILTVWPHGDEPIGPMVGHHLYTQAPELLKHVDYICGNPRAAAETPPTRYTATGTDLNRSFAPEFQSDSYEKKRAQEILELIEKNRYDYVLDLHTSLTQADRCLIIDSASLASEGVRRIIQASPIQKIVSFPSWIAQEGLIGQAPNAVSLEYQKSLTVAHGIGETIQTIKALVAGISEEYTPIERSIFHVDGHIKKGEEPEAGARDYELSKAGYYPILYGGSYKRDPNKTYSGFKADNKSVELI